MHYMQGNYAQALEHYEKSLALSEAIGDKEDISATLTDVGQTYRALNRLVPARQAFEEAITAIETLRAQVAGGELDQQRAFEGRLAPYQSMVELLLAQNESAAALAYAERAKARVLLDVLHSGRVIITKAMTAAEQEQERGFNNHLVSLNTQISRENLRQQPDPARLDDLKAQLQKTRLDYEAFQTDLYAAHPELKTQRGQVEPLTPEQAADLLPDAQSALLEYVVTDDRTYLFALTRNDAGTATELKVYPLEIKRKELSERAAQFREILAKGSPGFRQPARGLYDLLIKPAAAQLRGRTSLIIVPDGSLWELPFQALQPSATRYLIEDCAIAYAPSLTALGEMIKLRDRRRDSTGPSTLLAFGNPALGTETISRAKSVLMDEKLYPLPDAEREVNVIKQIYGPANSRVYVGAEAREERVKAEAGGYRILHLATHGILNDSNPMYSHLVLAQAEGDTSEDGLLEAWEIMKLDLNADLAVLSACETARGRVGAGEGMIGLSWALFVAGCPTSVLSQWKVDSAGTTELMVEFHRQLKSQMATGSNRISAARALREAALKLLRTNRYRHPFYWAGFVVTGKGF
jgi:CHAT domain-containing protein